MTDIEVIAPVGDDLSSLALDELAEMAAIEYSSYAGMLVGALGRFIRMGQVLIEARTRFPVDGGGDWKRWCIDLGIDHASISNSMRLAYHVDHLPESVFQPWMGRDGKVRSPSINRALTYVRGLPDVGSRGWQQYGDEVKAEARRLIGQGLTQAEVADMLGTTKTSVRNWTNPAARKSYERQLKANNQRRRNQRRAAEREDRKREMAAEVKAASSDASRVYALLRRTIAAADLVVSSDMADAIRHLHKAEEAVVAAMRAGRQS